MKIKVGIVGMPNVGKSTFLNLMTQKYVAQEGEWPFTTINPNRGIVLYDKEEFLIVFKKFGSKSIKYPELEFIDVAGLVKDAYKGKGLGNEFLSHLKEADILIEIVRTFEKENVPHQEGNIDPERDHKIIQEELLMSDIKICERNQKKDKILEKIKEKILKKEKLDDDQIQVAKSYGLFALKEKIIIENGKRNLDWVDFSFSFKEDFNHELKIKIIEKILDKLNLTFFITANENETRISLIEKNSNFKEAAKIVHSDFEKKTIKVQVIELKDFLRGEERTKIFNKNDKIIPESIYKFIF